MATYSSNTTMKFEGTTIAISNGGSYTVPAGKYFIGCANTVSNGTSSATITVLVNSVAICTAALDSFGGTCSSSVNLHLGPGSVILTGSTQSGGNVYAYASVVGMLYQNTP